MNVRRRSGPVAGSRAAAAPLELTAEATRENAAVLRRRFRGWVARLADEEAAEDLTLAVYEALANVVDHAYAGRDRPGPMTLRARASPPLPHGRDVVVTVVDEGEWRRGTAPGRRGRGLPLMRELTRVTSVRAGPAGTTLQLRRRVGVEAAGREETASDARVVPTRA